MSLAAVPPGLRPAVQQWLQWDRNPETRGQVEGWAASGDRSALQAAFGTRMAFGTAGLRSKMGPGTARMNDLTVLQASQGLVAYVKQEHAAGRLGGAELSLVVGYDARHNSQKWARLVACACAHAGVRCHLYSERGPTPLVPFAVGRLRAAAGVMITASHNPPKDNGYKVYWSTAAQIIPPHDSNIARSIEANLEPWGDDVWAHATISQHALVSDPLGTMLKAYIETVKGTVRPGGGGAVPPLVYTPVHGVGHSLVEAVFSACDFPQPIVPPEQKHPDPDFPTASFPNPEEAGVLDLSMALGDRCNANYVLANDPDADRLCIAEKAAGKWRVFSGNELGALFAWWAWTRRPSGVPAGDCVMIASAVSSTFIGSMARREGFRFQQTLTGFKWMGTRAAEYAQAGRTVLFAFEEAIGYMHGATGLWDKDGVSAAVIVADMIAWVTSQRSGPRTLAAQLEQLMATYGWHVQRNSYYISPSPSVTKEVFKRLRNTDPARAAQFGTAAPQGLSYPASAGGFKVTGVRDLTAGFDSMQPGGRPTLPGSPDEMITFYFANSAQLTLRSSGTEPKVKYYSELVGERQAESEAALSAVVGAVVREWLQPERNGLAPPHGTAKL